MSIHVKEQQILWKFAHFMELAQCWWKHISNWHLEPAQCGGAQGQIHPWGRPDDHPGSQAGWLLRRRSAFAGSRALENEGHKRVPSAGLMREGIGQQRQNGKKDLLVGGLGT